MKLNIYKTIEWNYVLRVVVSLKFHCILFEVAFLETNAMKHTIETGFHAKRKHITWFSGNEWLSIL